MEITYEEYSNKTLKERIVYIEDWISKEHEVNNVVNIKRFLRDVLEKESNSFIRIMSIEILSFLTVTNQIRKSSMIDMLLDIEKNDDPLVVITSLKYLSLFYDDSEVLKKLEISKSSNDPDVSSEAYYRLGLIKIFNTSSCENEVDFYNKLCESGTLFKYSTSSTENRTDAEYFYHVTNYLKFILLDDEENFELTLKKLLNASFIRKAFTYNETYLALEYKINDILLNMFELYKRTTVHKSWLDYYKEFSKLAYYHSELLSVCMSENQFQNRLISSFKKNISDQVLRNLYIKGFNQYELKINNIMSTYDDCDLIQFLSYVKEAIKEDESKKKDNGELTRISLKFKEIIPEANPLDLLQTLKTKKDIESVENVLSLVAHYAEKKHDHNFEFLTGYPVGDEIYNSLLESINLNLPTYDKEKLHIFMKIMEQIIRYLILTIRSKRFDEYNFLYTEDHGGKGSNASERDLQDSLYKHFQYTSMAYGVEEEISNFSDGGRIDIVYKVKSFTFPIELKKTKQEISSDSIRKKYLGQLHSYVYSYDQLGIFVLLDLNNKIEPVNDVRDLVYLDKLEPLYNIKNKYPNYIVVVIIPGNKPLPSDRSIYR
ncbi:hypothetical protein ACTHP3_17100 [Shouchella rhizosphaerae]|uniref:hypothetical protein n=1 Tax=Shouchella rhizosphaerae TaxID=866786 RepID=UPI003F7F4A12